MSFEEHVNELCRAAFDNIRNISRIHPCLSIDSTKTLVHALVTSRLDHCNSLLYGLPDYLIQRLQYVMNAAAKVITCKRTFDHATPLLIELHWLPVRQRIVLKILLYRLQRTWLSSSVLMFLGELLGLLTNFYWSSQCTSSNWLAWGLYPCGRLTSGTLPFEIKSSASVFIFKAKLKTYLSSTSTFLDFQFFSFLIFRTFWLLSFSILRTFYIFWCLDYNILTL